MRLSLIAACLIFVGFAAFKGSSGFFEESSLAVDDKGCDMSSSDSFEKVKGLPEAGSPHLLQLTLSECESGTLKSVYYDVSGAASEQIYNTEPMNQLSYVFLKSGDYHIDVNYSVELTSGVIVQRKLPLDLEIK